MWHMRVEHVVLYSDTCKGRVLVPRVSMKSKPISLIDHRFVDSGPSQMEHDGLYAARTKCACVHNLEGYYTPLRTEKEEQSIQGD